MVAHSVQAFGGEQPMTDPVARRDEIVARLRNGGHRLTPQRMAVLTILTQGYEHPSAEQIYERVRVDLPITSLATVYKTVSLLKEMGEVLELGFGDNRSYYDGRNPSPHPHLICVRCRKIVDSGTGVLDKLAEKLGPETGYQILSHRLDFFGICPQCQQHE
jgi:Fur family peroxide stress response transcriptional regulator